MKDLTKGIVWKQILNFSIPMLIGSMLQHLYTIIDSVIVGKFLGNEALGAVGASFPVIFALTSLVIGITSGCGILISQFFGAKQMNNIKKTIDTMFVFLFIAAILLTILSIVFSNIVFEMIKLPAPMIPMAKTYFIVYSMGFIFMFGYNGTSAVLRGMGDSRTPLVFLAISTVLNIAFDLIFILIFGWGIWGAAFATVIAQAVAFLYGVYYLNRTHPIIRFSFFKINFDKAIFSKSIRIGIPSGMQQTFVALGMMALYRIVNDFGTNAVAAYSAAVRINSFTSLPAMTFAAALTTFVGQNIGAGKTERVRQGFISTAIITMIYSIVITLVVVFLGHFIMQAFTDSPEVIEIGASYLQIVGSFYVIFGLMFITQGLLRGAGDTVVPMVITLFSLWLLRIPASYIFSKYWGTDGIWWGIPFAWVAGFIFAWIYYLNGKWKKKALIEPVIISEEFE